MDNDLSAEIFRLAPDAMVVFDDDGTILEANEQAGVLFGVPPAEIPGRNLAVFGPPGWDVRPGIQRLLNDGAARDDFRLVRGDQVIDVEYSSRARIAPGRHLTVIRDISEKKRREHSLRDSEELFARAFLGAPAALSVSDEGGRFVVVNELFLEFTGHWRSDVIGRSAEELQLWAIPEERTKAGLALRSAPVVPCFRASFRSKTADIREMVVCLAAVQIHGKPYVVTTAFKPD